MWCVEGTIMWTSQNYLAMFHKHLDQLRCGLVPHHVFIFFDSKFIKIMRNNFFVCARNTTAITSTAPETTNKAQRNVVLSRWRTQIRFQLAPLLAFISPAHCHRQRQLRRVLVRECNSLFSFFPFPFNTIRKCCDYLPLLIYANSFGQVLWFFPPS